jgi:hypothetical protein
MKRLLVGFILLAGCATDPRRPTALEGTWKGSGTPSAGSTIAVEMFLLPDDATNAHGAATFTATAGSTANQSYQSVEAVLTSGSTVTISLHGATTGSVAFFDGQLSGTTMTGKMSGGGFPSSGTSITLTRTADH